MIKTMNADAAWDILTAKKTEKRPESRTAFIAALLMQHALEQGQIIDMTPHKAQLFAAELVTLAESLQGLAVAACNYELSKGQETRRTNLAIRFTAIAEALGFRVKVGGDPRGAVCRLFGPSDDRAGDGWAGGWAVYR